MSDSIPVTILSGSLGAGKTTLLNHLLKNAGERDIAVLVNDMGQVNIDAELVAEGSELDVDGGVAELSNGCICCELQDDLETAVVRLARDRDFDALVVESSGISEPAPVARLFTTESRVAALYEVDALVTVVDTRQFIDAFAGASVPERQTSADDEDRPLSDLLVEQLEVANVVLLNKVDLCTPSEVEEADELVRALQPDARIIHTEFSQADPDDLLGVGLFDADELGELPGWKRALAAAEHDHGSESNSGSTTDHHEHAHRHPDEVYGITSETYRTRRPFHPDRIASFLEDLPEGIVRSKGTLWIADNDMRLTMGQAGPSVRVTAQGPWIATLPEIDQDLYRSNRPTLDWDEEHGDRKTELVFIGTDVDRDALFDALDDCLVTDSEWDAGVDDGGVFPTEQGEESVIREP